MYPVELSFANLKTITINVINLHDMYLSHFMYSMSGYVPSQPLDYWAQNQQQQQQQDDSYNFEMPVQQDFQHEL